jgi:site-specific DNA recombinase
MEGKKCLIYCRVSSQRQVDEGHGLDSQEIRCQEYAKSQGYQIIGVFRDEGESGGLFERTGMQQVLSCLESNIMEPERVIVIFDDLKRFARDTQVHFALKKEIYSRNGSVESPNFKFEDTPDGKFVETVMAAHAELERNQNKRQVIQKMKARLESGYWPFNPPIGLVNKKDELHGKILSPVEPFASIFSEAIIKFARGVLMTLDETQKFILKKYAKYKIIRKLSINGTRLILSQPLYYGLIQYLPWDVSLAKAQHEGFVDENYYFKIQDIFNKKTKYGKRRDLNSDFPIRGLVNCVGCGRPLTGSWNKGRTKKYANYSCKTKDCMLRYKVIGKDKIEGDFTVLLKDIKPQKEAVDLTSAVLKDVWDSMRKTYLKGVEVNRTRLLKIGGDISSFGEMMLRTESADMKMYYEGEIEKLLCEKKSLSSNQTEMFTRDDFGTATDTVIGVLKNPVKLWKKGDVLEKRMAFNMYFLENLPYDKKGGFGTASFSPVVGLLQSQNPSKNNLVETAGFEPASEKVQS